MRPSCYGRGVLIRDVQYGTRNLRLNSDLRTYSQSG